jgi:guanylate kinase
MSQAVMPPPPTDDTHLQGRLFVLMGPSGVGKNALMPGLMLAVPQLRRLPTAATRSPRPGEQEGVDHYFVSVDRFREMITNGELVEHVEVHPGKFYGTVRAVTEQALQRGEMLLADIDVQGAAALRAAFPKHVITLFILPPSLETLGERLQKRGNMTEQDMQERLSRAAYEMAQAKDADYQVVNDDLSACVANVAAFVGQAIRQTQA